MYKVIIKVLERKSQSEKERRIFQLGVADSHQFTKTMDEIADFLYDADLEFGEDDLDMVLDDILVDISDQESFRDSLKGKNYIYEIVGENE